MVFTLPPRWGIGRTLRLILQVGRAQLSYKQAEYNQSTSAGMRPVWFIEAWRIPLNLCNSPHHTLRFQSACFSGYLSDNKQKETYSTSIETYVYTSICLSVWIEPATHRMQGGDYSTVPLCLSNCGWGTCLQISLRGGWDSNLWTLRLKGGDFHYTTMFHT
jgi:hypothetical protein